MSTLPVACLLATIVAAPPGDTAAESAEAHLSRLAQAWQGEREVKLDEPVRLKIVVQGEGGGAWYLDLTNAPRAALRQGTPPDWDLAFTLDVVTLGRMVRGELNALTAMGQARSSDPIPLRPELSERFAKRTDASLLFRRISHHFWSPGFPEVVRFNERAARLVHGANAVVLFYDRAFRSAWFQVKPGMHMNEAKAERANKFPNAIIVVRGSLQARLDGTERTLREGEAVLIPAGVEHEFWARPDQGAELIWLAFGEGA